MPALPEPPAGRDLPPGVSIREVGPRDGLQNEAPVPPAERARLVRALADAGCRSIEAVSFVSERAVPAMAGAAEVIALVSGGESDESAGTVATGGTAALDVLRLTALVPNLRGAERAIEAGLTALTVTISASAAYNEKNVRMTIEESLRQIESVASLAGSEAIAVDAVVSCCFGSPFEGDIDPGEVADLAAKLTEAGCGDLTLADTTGVASPRRLDSVLSALEARTGRAPRDVGLHLHDTRGTALVNAWAAMETGVRRFDTSIGGLGGSPFAPGAGGNLATEELVALLDDVGVTTGIRLPALLRACAIARDLVGHPLASRTMSALEGSARAY